jgi:hypothetical protein
MIAASVTNIEAAISALVLVHVHVESTITTVQMGAIYTPPGVIGAFLRMPDIPSLCLDGYRISVKT